MENTAELLEQEELDRTEITPIYENLKFQISCIDEISKSLKEICSDLEQRDLDWKKINEIQDKMESMNISSNLSDIKREYNDIFETITEYAKEQENMNYNLIPYAKSITYRDIQGTDQFHGQPCRIVSESRYNELFKLNSFAIQFNSQSISTRDAALSNLIIDVDLKDEKRLNDFGLVSKRQLEKLDHIISVVNDLDKKRPKTPEEVFAKAFIKPFKTKYMEDAEDIKQGNLEKGVQTACYALNAIFSEKISKEEYKKLGKLAQELSPVSLDKYWIKQQENKKQIQR